MENKNEDGGMVFVFGFYSVFLDWVEYLGVMNKYTNYNDFSINRFVWRGYGVGSFKFVVVDFIYNLKCRILFWVGSFLVWD